MKGIIKKKNRLLQIIIDHILVEYFDFGLLIVHRLIHILLHQQEENSYVEDFHQQYVEIHRSKSNKIFKKLNLFSNYFLFIIEILSLCVI